MPLKSMPVPEGCTEIFEVYQQIKTGLPGKLYGFFKAENALDVKLFVMDLNLKWFSRDTNKKTGECRDPQQYRYRHKAAIQFNNRWHLVNITNINVKELPHEQDQQIPADFHSEVESCSDED